MMFQRALPEVDGFGVTTEIPGLIRSLHPVMCLGLPLRTTITTSESLTIPLYGLASQLLEMSPAFSTRLMSDSVEKLTTSAGWPEATARLWAPDEPNDVENVTPLPCAVCA